ncbi:MAG: GC-type dockerin domain-anchored protein, partial [Phycisphaerales bacterium]
ALNTAANAGVYAMKMELWNSSSTIAPSEPYFLVLSLNASAQDRDAAIEHISRTYLAAAPTGCSPADIANTDGEPLPAGGPDNTIDNGDFTAFFSAFFLADTDPARLVADIANTDGDTALTGAGPDGTVDNGDFTAFFASFFAGCP